MSRYLARYEESIQGYAITWSGKDVLKTETKPYHQTPIHMCHFYFISVFLSRQTILKC